MEDMYTPIHNDLLEELMKQRLSTYEWQTLLCIMRQTYGYIDKAGKRKKTEWVTNQKISEMTGIKKNHVSRSVSKLITKGFVKKEVTHIGINKDFYRLPKQVTFVSEIPKQVTFEEIPKQVSIDTQTGILPIPKQVFVKGIKKEYKETNKERVNVKFCFKPPKPQDVIDYARSINFEIDGQYFCDSYESKGWMIGNSKIKSWKACVRTWKKRESQFKTSNSDRKPVNTAKFKCSKCQKEVPGYMYRKDLDSCVLCIGNQ